MVGRCNNTAYYKNYHVFKRKMNKEDNYMTNVLRDYL
jgi:hypothetical protein